MRSKYVWMDLSIMVIGLAVFFTGVLGPAVKTSIGVEYGLELESGTVAVPVGYCAAVAILLMFLSIDVAKKKESADMYKRYLWATLAIVIIWLAVVVVSWLGLTFEVAGASADGDMGTATWPVAVPVAFLAAVATVIITKFFVDFGVGNQIISEQDQTDSSHDSSSLMA